MTDPNHLKRGQMLRVGSFRCAVYDIVKDAIQIVWTHCHGIDSLSKQSPLWRHLELDV